MGKFIFVQVNDVCRQEDFSSAVFSRKILRFGELEYQRDYYFLCFWFWLPNLQAAYSSITL